MELPHLSPPQVRILQAALAAVEPGAAVRRFMQRSRGQLAIAGRTYDLDRCAHVHLAGGGKAAAPMALAAAEILGEYLSGGVLVTKTGHAAAEDRTRLPGVTLAEAAHPVPDERGVQAGRKVLALAQGAGQDDLLICLLSGGGSALLTAPHVPLAGLQTLTGQLLACGAAINEINCLRKHLDAVKGGGLARAALPADVAALVLSDVVGDPLDVIASGPTVPDSSTFEDAWEVLAKYGLTEQVPDSVRSRLQQGLRGEVPDTSKPGDPCFERVQNVIVGSNRLAAEAALAQARREGYQTHLLTTSLQGEAGRAGREMAALLRESADGRRPLRPPACLVAGGETTVVLGPDPGLGGRNQELALAAVDELAGLQGAMLVTLATDGGDGPTDAAGAVVQGSTRAQAEALGLAAGDFLRRHDAYHFFEAIGGLVKTGPTRTNVNDLLFLFLDPPCA